MALALIKSITPCAACDLNYTTNSNDPILIPEPELAPHYTLPLSLA